MDESFLNVISSANDDSILMPLQHLNGTMHGGHMANTTGRETFDDDGTVSSQVIVWCCVVAVVFCFCLRPDRRWDPSYRSSLAERERRIRRVKAKKDPAHRRLVINKSLITKSVIECDKDGNLTLGDIDPDGKSVGQSCTSCSSNDDYSNACVICLEAFQVGDTVSWSKDMSCLHVFHHDCILQWLENPKHDDCPSCRNSIVDFDYDDSSDCGCHHEEEEDDLDVPSSAPIAFIIIDGLVSRARRASFSLKGNSVDTHTPFGDMPPTIDLRRVLSEGSDAVGVRTISLLHRLSLRRGSSRAYSRIVTLDTVDSDVESQLRSTDDTLSLKRSIRMRRSVSEGAFYESMSLPMGEPASGLLLASRVALARVSSGLYSRISLKFDSDDSSKSFYHDNDLDEEEDIVMDEYDSADQPSNTNVHLEIGVSSGLVRVL